VSKSITITTDHFFRVPNEMMQDLCDQKIDGHALAVFWLTVKDAAGRG
jgi:hypothetical protein